MQDPSFEEDTLFLIFEEDMRFHEDTDENAIVWVPRQGDDRKHGELWLDSTSVLSWAVHALVCVHMCCAML